ncbi:MAG: carboxypeptidase regulatory-like domain-containing protein [Flavobacteriales bacterium]|nr:carboxypeptidase regulatory-like domain-containing protein [Flavobacteriales bacterium]MCB9191635.1 carboxypeptidase regulatory-like domain-containing protein [Flavobacteriales bacterium]MCB9204449.1 carboxypeptidase regulatory-like domain-containing protein [Flavobacteriales bacterium]
MKKLLQLLLGVISHLLLTSMSVAQENAGIIYGTVISESNEVMPLSTVALFKDSQIAAGIITDDEGNFILGNLDPGIYDLKISSVGFASKYIRKIVVSEEEIHIPPIVLKWGIQLSPVVCEAVRPFCNKPCGYGCICECCVPSVSFNEDEAVGRVGVIPQVDTLNYLSLVSWRK